MGLMTTGTTVSVAWAVSVFDGSGAEAGGGDSMTRVDTIEFSAVVGWFEAVPNRFRLVMLLGVHLRGDGSGLYIPPLRCVPEIVFGPTEEVLATLET